MMGPRKPKIRSGRPEDNAYTTKPWTPATVDISGYVKRIPDPRAARIQKESLKLVRHSRHQTIGARSGSTFPTQALT